MVVRGEQRSGNYGISRRDLRESDLQCTICPPPPAPVRARCERWFAKARALAVRTLQQHQVDPEAIGAVERFTLLEFFWGATVCVSGSIAAFMSLVFVLWLLRPRLSSIAPAAVPGQALAPYLEPALVTIATNGFSAASLVASARGEGGFTGDIFVLGDGCGPPHATFVPVRGRRPFFQASHVLLPPPFPFVLLSLL